MRRTIFILGAVALACLALASVFALSTDRILDPDSFYHIKHASLYRTNGIFESEFPWLQFSVVRIYAADLWYGFHLLLVPFTLFGNLILGIKLSGIFLTSAGLTLFCYALMRLRIRYPFFWTLLLYFSAADFLFRMNMARPQTLSLGLLALLFSLFVAEKKMWAIAVAGFLIAFIHLSFFWIALFVAGAVALASLLVARRFAWRESFSFLLGLIFGWFLRPHPLGALHLVWVQVFQLAFEKGRSAPLLFGTDILPLDWATIGYQLIPFLVVALAAIAAFSRFVWRGETRKAEASIRITLWSSFGLTVLFFMFAFFLGRRAADIGILFGIMFMAQLVSWRLSEPSRALKAVALAVLAIFIARHAYTFAAYARADNTIPADKLKEVSLYLKENTAPRSIVFHTSWDLFPMLFFWNDQNYYITGMDPIFEYALSKELYWKNHFIAIGGKPYTCAELPCTEEHSEPLYHVLKNDFRASYVVAERSRNAGFIRNLAADSNFEQIFETAGEVVYRLK